MRFTIALGRAIDLEATARDSQGLRCPRHVMWDLSKELGATIRVPGAGRGSVADRARAKVAGRPEHWALARELAARLDGGDFLYCTGEDVGIPVAAVCGAKRDRPRIAVFFHNIDRPRGRAAARLFRLKDRIDLFVTNATHQADFLRDYLRVPESRIFLHLEQTDRTFFTPGPASPGKVRPVIASVGLEGRDYRCLAEATRDLDVDVKISGFSRDATALARAFPEELPANMSRRFYEWPELVQLYRDADVVAIPLAPSLYTAGVTVLLEAMACRRPVVITRTRGLSDYLAPPAVALAVGPGDAGGMRRAIVDLLSNPARADELARLGHDLVAARHDSDRYVRALAARLATS